MGCSNIVSETIYDNSDIKMEITGEESLDDVRDYLIKYFKRAENVLREIEVMRILFVCEWGELLYNSGALTLLNPTFTNVVYGILYQIARDIQIV